MRVLLVIPAFNEEESLRGLLEEIHAVRPTATWTGEVVVIDDGSTDRTAEVAAACGVRVVRLCRNLGIGGAVQTGLRIAHREGFDGAIQVDGDGQHPPREVDRLIARAQGPDAPDLVIGSRRLEQRGYQATAARRVGQIWLRFWLRLICGQRVTDPTSGFRLYGPRALALFQQTYPYDFPEPEAIAIASARGLVVTEQPVEMRSRQGGRSSIIGLKPVYYMIKVTLAVVLSYMRHRAGKPAAAPSEPAPAGGPHASRS